MPRSSITEIMSAFEPVEREGLLLSTPDGARRRTLRRWTEQGRLISPHPGLFARPEYWSAMSRTEQEICRLRTLAKLHPAWMFCSYSAAVLQGLSVSHSLLDRTAGADETARPFGTIDSEASYSRATRRACSSPKSCTPWRNACSMHRFARDSPSPTLPFTEACYRRRRSWRMWEPSQETSRERRGPV